jgi:hypothetical protein
VRQLDAGTDAVAEERAIGDDHCGAAAKPIRLTPCAAVQRGGRPRRHTECAGYGLIAVVVSLQSLSLARRAGRGRIGYPLSCVPLSPAVAGATWDLSKRTTERWNQPAAARCVAPPPPALLRRPSASMQGARSTQPRRGQKTASPEGRLKPVLCGGSTEERNSCSWLPAPCSLRRAMILFRKLPYLRKAVPGKGLSAASRKIEAPRCNVFGGRAYYTRERQRAQRQLREGG